MKRILITEDDGDVNALITEALARAGGFETVSAFSGTEALLRLENGGFDMVLLDVMLPGKSGEAVLAEIRRTPESSRTNGAPNAFPRDLPVIVISAVIDKTTKLRLLDMGADDYIIKPFDVDELVSRVHAVFRRTGRADSIPGGNALNGESGGGELLHFRDLQLDLSARTAMLAGEPLSLTAREFDLLRTLMQHPKKVFSRMNLYESVWNESYLGDERTVNVHISNLRSKLVAAQGDDIREYIRTVWGIGFIMAE